MTMTIFAYRCLNKNCDALIDSTVRADKHPAPCPACGGVLQRKWSVAVRPGMQEHFNHTVGKPISSMAQMRSELSRQSDEYFDKTGIPTKFVPKEWGELGATQEGMDDVNRSRVNRGDTALRIPGE